VLIADGRGGADFHGASEDMGRNVGTVWLVAKVFGEQFFLSVWSSEACLDGYLRNRKSPSYHYLMRKSLLTQVVSRIRIKLPDADTGRLKLDRIRTAEIERRA
jgi:hypothetical protein